MRVRQSAFPHCNKHLQRSLRGERVTLVMSLKVSVLGPVSPVLSEMHPRVQGVSAELMSKRKELEPHCPLQ